jgi:hypothetical protein
LAKEIALFDWVTFVSRFLKTSEFDIRRILKVGALNSEKVLEQINL